MMRVSTEVILREWRLYIRAQANKASLVVRAFKLGSQCIANAKEGRRALGGTWPVDGADQMHAPKPLQAKP